MLSLSLSRHWLFCVDLFLFFFQHLLVLGCFFACCGVKYLIVKTVLPSLDSGKHY